MGDDKLWSSCICHTSWYTWLLPFSYVSTKNSASNLGTFYCCPGGLRTSKDGLRPWFSFLTPDSLEQTTDFQTKGLHFNLLWNTYTWPLLLPTLPWWWQGSCPCFGLLWSDLSRLALPKADWPCHEELFQLQSAEVMAEGFWKLISNQGVSVYL